MAYLARIDFGVSESLLEIVSYGTEDTEAIRVYLTPNLIKVFLSVCIESIDLLPNSEWFFLFIYLFLNLYTSWVGICTTHWQE